MAALSAIAGREMFAIVERLEGVAVEPNASAV
jgi:hypothetical protein